MPHAVNMPTTGLQALILCGPGSSFPTFTSNPDEHPKALLPIANRPMVWYSIEFCYRMGVTNITLICPPSASKALTTALNTNPFLTGLPLPRPDILAPQDLDHNTGTAEILRLPEISELVEGDFIVLPCDLVCDLGGEQLIQAWMVKSASLTDVLGTSSFVNGSCNRASGGLGVWFDTKANPLVKGEETDFVAVTSLPASSLTPPKNSLFAKTFKLACSMPTDSLNDLTEEKKGLPIRHSLSRTHNRVRFLTNHRDAHIYIFPRWVLDFIKQNDRLESIGEDVVGWWAKAGWQTGLADKLHITEICDSESLTRTESTGGSIPESAPSPGRPSSQGSENKDSSRKAVSTDDAANESRGQLESVRDRSLADVPSMLAYVHSRKDETEALIRRVDNAQLLLATSLQLAKIPSLEETGAQPGSPYAHAKKVAYPEGVKSRTTITKIDSLVADNVTVEEKTSIKESVVGVNCQLNEGAKLSQCLLMEGVVIGKNCKLTKCILGKRCVIGDGSVLTNCEVQENLYVEPRTEDKDNKLMSSEGLEATEAEMDEVLNEKDDEGAFDDSSAVED